MDYRLGNFLFDRLVAEKLANDWITDVFINNKHVPLRFNLTDLVNNAITDISTNADKDDELFNTLALDICQAEIMFALSSNEIDSRCITTLSIPVLPTVSLLDYIVNSFQQHEDSYINRLIFDKAPGIFFIEFVSTDYAPKCDQNEILVAVTENANNVDTDTLIHNIDMTLINSDIEKERDSV